MSRRFFVVPALIALAAAPFAHASDRAPRSSAREAIARFAPRVELDQLFARFADPGVSLETEDGVSAPMGAMEVIVARLGTDGKPVTACVDNEKSANRFFQIPIEHAQRGRKQQQ